MLTIQSRTLYAPILNTETIQNYSRVNTALLGLVIAFASPFEDTANTILCEMPLNDHHKKAAVALLSHLEKLAKARESGTDAPTDVETDELWPLLDFIDALFAPKPDGESDATSVFLSVLALHGLKSCGSFIPPDLLTPDLAKVRGLCNVFIVTAADLRVRKSGDNRQKLPVFCA